MYFKNYNFLESLEKLIQIQILQLIGVQQGSYFCWENGTLEP